MSDVFIFFRKIVLCTCLFCGGISDMYRLRVGNSCIACSFLAISLGMIIFHEDLLLSMAGAALLILFLFPTYKNGLFGAADIKLFALVIFAFPSFYGLEILFLSLLYGLIFIISLRLSFYIQGFRERYTGSDLRARGGLWKRWVNGPLLKSRIPLAPFLLFGSLTRFIF